MGGICSTSGESRGVYRVLVEKFEGKRQLGRPKCRWYYNINMDLQEVGCGAWWDLSRLKIETGGGTCECGNEHSGSVKCGEFLD